MKEKLMKADYIELNERIIENLCRSINDEEILSSTYYKTICPLIFNSKDELKKIILDPKLDAYCPSSYELSMKSTKRKSPGRHTLVAEDRIQRHDDASYGASLGMASVGITDPKQPH